MRCHTAPPIRRREARVEFTSAGSIVVRAPFRGAETGWYEGLGAMARVGTSLIIDEVFLDGGNSQARLRIALEGLPVLWVGVRCQGEVAEARELQRSDRHIGLARDQVKRGTLGRRLRRRRGHIGDGAGHMCNGDHDVAGRPRFLGVPVPENVMPRRGSSPR